MKQLILSMLIAVFLSQTALANAEQSAPQTPTADDDFAQRQALADQRAEWVNNAESGVFLLANGGDYMPSLLLSSKVDVQVSGPVSKVTLTQKFFNSGSEFAEGLYVFPLPENAAVSAMQMRVGERLIVGEIKEKAEAKQIYEQAKREGKRAAIVQQRRPNLFTSDVANIAAGESIEVVIEYSQLLETTDSHYELRVPMTMTPRYSPQLGRNDQTAGPIFSAKALSPASNQAQISVVIDGQLALSGIESNSHEIRHQLNNGRYEVSTHQPWVAMDSDFVLTWSVAASSELQTAFYHEQVDGEHYGLLQFFPPQQVANQSEVLNYDPAREVIFVVDSSGSMGGESMRQAQQALLQALETLDGKDHFNIVEFDSANRLLFSQTERANADSLGRARGFIRQMQADGGTEILPAVMAALNMPSAEPAESMRQIVFITDGAVSNEEEIFAAIHQLLGDARLFTVGIGSAPNSYFMRKAAEFGRGSFTYVNSTEDVLAQMSQLFQRLESPLLTDLSLSLPEGVSAVNWPQRIPDLYAGQPVQVSMKLSELPTQFTISGRGEKPWQQQVSLDAAQSNPSIGTLWARRKIEALMDQQIKSNQYHSQRDAIVEVALAHQLLTPYTSFVAVDKTPVRAQNQALEKGQIPNQQPKGANYPSTALGTGWQLLMALLFALLALWLQTAPVARQPTPAA